MLEGWNGGGGEHHRVEFRGTSAAYHGEPQSSMNDGAKVITPARYHERVT
jgi:hypothetical protein